MEDHWIGGSLGDAVAAAVGSQAPMNRLGVTEEPHSGTQDQLLHMHGISRQAIQQKVTALAAQLGSSAA